MATVTIRALAAGTVTLCAPLNPERNWSGREEKRKELVSGRVLSLSLRNTRVAIMFVRHALIVSNALLSGPENDVSRTVMAVATLNPAVTLK